MKIDKRYHRLFPTDIATATRYYDLISVDLGNRFRDCVRDRLDSIGDRPESFGFVRQPLRVAMVVGFPYVVVFRLVEQVVFVAGLYHASSDPNRWLTRIDEGAEHVKV